MAAPSRQRPRLLVWLLVAYLIGAALLLLTPLSPSRIVEEATDVVRDTLGWGFVRPGWVEFGLNVVLFVPLGLIVTLLSRRWWVGVVASVIVSAGAELVQTLFPARLSSARDVLANVGGALIGAVIALFIERRGRRGVAPIGERPGAPRAGAAPERD